MIGSSGIADHPREATHDETWGARLASWRTTLNDDVSAACNATEKLF